MTLQTSSQQTAPEKNASAPQPKWKIENPTPRTVVVERVEVQEPAGAVPDVKTELPRIPASVRASIG